jgi:hypothetical protein
VRRRASFGEMLFSSVSDRQTASTATTNASATQPT